MSLSSRRCFLQRAARYRAAAAFVVAGTKSSGCVLGANDRVRASTAVDRDASRPTAK